MQPPVEHRGARARASAGQAARFLAVCAASTGVAGGGCALLQALQRPPVVWTLVGAAVVLALLSWALAVAAVLTAAAALRVDRRSRSARAARLIALPGALAGTAAVAAAIAWVASWSLSR